MTKRRAPLLLFLAAALLCCGLLAAAGGGAWIASRRSNGSAGAETVITRFDPAKPDSFLQLEEMIMDPATHASAAEAAIAHLEDADAGSRYAAIYLLVNVGTEDRAPELAMALDDPVLGLRAIAAGRLIGLGQKEAIPVLIEALTASDAIPYSDPPRPVWTLAREALPHYTGEDFGLIAAADSAAAAATAAQWQAWWQALGASLQWDASAEKYAK